MGVRRALGMWSAVWLAACSSEAAPSDDMEPPDMQTAVTECEDDPASLYADPGELPEERGAIMRCVSDGVISPAQIAVRLAALESDSTHDAANGVLNTYQGPAPELGTRVYRVLYKTQRGNGAAGHAVATMYVPDVAEPAEKKPLVLLARGSRGQAQQCAPSRTTDGPVTTVDSPDGRYVQDDLESMLWPLVSAGFPVAVTDSAGYANFGAAGNPVSAYADVQDMGRSLLDSGHALRALAPAYTSDEVLLVGLSQGGHSVLGSLEVANEYDAPGKILAAAVYAPLWFAQRVWGVVMNAAAAEIGGVQLNRSSAVPVSIWYHYTHAELYDGPGEGLKLFKPEVQAAVKEFVNSTCWSESYRKLEEATKVGATGADFFSDEMVAAISTAALQRSCDDSPNKPLCDKWMARYRADHPVLSGAAAQVPLLVAYGLKDQHISAQRFMCGVEKLQESVESLTFCVDPEANHAGIVLTQSVYVNQWLASHAGGAPVTATCPMDQPPDAQCDPLLPNDQ